MTEGIGDTPAIVTKDERSFVTKDKTTIFVDRMDLLEKSVKAIESSPRVLKYLKRPRAPDEELPEAAELKLRCKILKSKVANLERVAAVVKGRALRRTRLNFTGHASERFRSVKIERTSDEGDEEDSEITLAENRFGEVREFTFSEQALLLKTLKNQYACHVNRASGATPAISENVNPELRAKAGRLKSKILAQLDECSEKLNGCSAMLKQRRQEKKETNEGCIAAVM